MDSVPRPIRTGANFDLTVELRVPLAFAFRWCTDYRSEDLSPPSKRWVLERSPAHLVFEDFNEDSPDGFEWRRLFVELKPPNLWRVECRGNRLEGSVWYALARRRPDRTALNIRGRARYLVPGTGKRIASSKRGGPELAGYFVMNWKYFGPKLEREYRESIRDRRRTKPNRPIRRPPRAGAGPPSQPSTYDGPSGVRSRQRIGPRGAAHLLTLGPVGGILIGLREIAMGSNVR